ncbi:hypothetical protein GCM10010109_50700 [Actinoplanes campanulatus]|nr:hypothetical protein GCM10010109_50700 [Actinoplanes campanulatus]GID37255.1 hypothetical protein Aca09nite_37610 [Actinoplanes campanulatus]
MGMELDQAVIDRLTLYCRPLNRVPAAPFKARLCIDRARRGGRAQARWGNPGRAR